VCIVTTTRTVVGRELVHTEVVERDDFVSCKLKSASFGAAVPRRVCYV